MSHFMILKNREHARARQTRPQTTDPNVWYVARNALYRSTTLIGYGITSRTEIIESHLRSER
jgi:hypothetical protein